MRQFSGEPFPQHLVMHFPINSWPSATRDGGNASPRAEEKALPRIASCGKVSFPHWRGTLTSKIAMREIPDPKSTMGEWYNIKSFPVFKKTGKLFPCFFAISEHFSTMREIISLFLRENHSLFFCYIGTFLY